MDGGAYTLKQSYLLEMSYLLPPSSLAGRARRRLCPAGSPRHPVVHQPTVYNDTSTPELRYIPVYKHLAVQQPTVYKYNTKVGW